MYHYRARRGKADRPIIFRTSTPPPVRAAAARQEPAMHTANESQQTAAVSPADAIPPALAPPPTQQDTPLVPLSPFDVQLCLFLLWWMLSHPPQEDTQAQQRHQHAAQGETAASERVETIIVDGVVVVPPPLDEALDEDVGVPRPSRPPRRGRKALVLLACGLVCLLALTALLIRTVFLPTVSVTVIPTQTTLHTSETLTLLTMGDTSTPTAHSIPGRVLSTLTLSQARAVATTGVGHQAAQGWVTFYNAALSQQTIPVGTLLTGRDGVQVVTGQDAVVPPAQLPAVGQTTIPAQAVQVGPAGNIAAGDLNGPCCREYVLVRNTAAFSGGQDARVYPMVTRHDLDGSVAALTTALDQSVQAAYAAQLAPTEALVLPVACTPQVNSSQPVGHEARKVTVTLSDTCKGVAYDEQALHAALLQRMTAQAQAQLGTGYTLLGDLQVNVVQQVTGRNTKQHASVTLSVQGTSTWAYQFSEADLQRLSHLVAGKNRQQAATLLLDQPGVGEVAMSTDALPGDPQHIQVLVLYRPVQDAHTEPEGRIL